MAESIRDWDTDWFDQFKKIFPASFTTMGLYPSDPISWINVVNIPFGQKQVERAIRKPDQLVNVSKNIEYPYDKYAARVVQVADMPSITDSLRIDEEYYAGATVNAVGHVGDITRNFKDAVINLALNGTGVSPLAYGLTDAGTGTSVLVARPDDFDVSTAGAWTITENMQIDIGNMEVELDKAGFTGSKAILTHPVAKPYMQLMIDYTSSVQKDWVTSYMGIPVYFHPLVHAGATKDACNLYMVDTTAFDLFTTPLKMRGFFDNNTEDFVWHWQTRQYLLARPKRDSTDAYYKKGLVLCALNLDG